MTGAGHLLSFTGTDTVPAIDFLEDYYGGTGFLGGSVPATEHSVMCAGMQDGEFETFRRLVENVYPKGIISIVSDTWDFWKVVTQFTRKLKDAILKREGKVVLRPDSGDPVKIICGDPSATPGSPEFRGAVECLWEIFGGTATVTGYKLLDTHIGLIYGDSITLQRAQEILSGLSAKGFASGNIVFGIGSFTYQHNTRDTFGHAIKATWCVVGGEHRPIFKDPKTDSGLKKSATGLLRVEREGNDFVLHDNQTGRGELGGELETIFVDGILHNMQSYDEIRNLLGTF